MAETPGIGLHLTDAGYGIATLGWDGDAVAAATLETLSAEVVALVERAFADSALRRVEVAVPSHLPTLRRAVLRAGFRVEGVRRAVVPLDDATFGDQTLLARLAEDTVGGAHGFSSVMNTVLPRKRLIAHVLMRDDQGRLLLCQTHFKPDWELPGGIVEPGETPRHGAIREVREELGIDLAVGRLLLVDWLPPYLGWEDALELIFDGGTVTQQQLDSYVLQPAEIIRVALVPVAEAAALVTPISHRRIAIATALAPGTMAYTEDGTVPE